MASSVQLEGTMDVLLRKYRDQKSALENMQEHLIALEKQMKSEEKDVAQLESDTFKAALFKLICIYEGQLSKEQSEYLKAKYNYENYQFEIQEAEKQLRLLEEKIKETEMQLKDHKEMLQEHLGRLYTYDKNAPQRLLYEKFTSKEKDCKAECVEIEEALAAYERACRAQKEVQKALKGASDWAFWDTWGGGGMMSDLAKYEKIEEAQNHFKHLAVELGHLKRELSDVGQNITFDIGSMDAMTKGLDIWFDNIFTDKCVKEEIQNQIQSINRLDQELESVRSNLDQKYNIASSALKAASEAVENVLLEM